MKSQNPQQQSAAAAARPNDPWSRLVQKHLKEFASLPVEVQRRLMMVMTAFHPATSTEAATDPFLMTPLQQVECWMVRHMAICADADDAQKQMDSWNFLGALFHTIQAARAPFATAAGGNATAEYNFARSDP